MINIEPYLSVIKEIRFDEYNIPVYLIDTNKLVNAIITKVAQTTALCTKYNHNPTRSTCFIKVFDTLNDYSIESLNSIVQRLLKFKDLGMNLLLYPVIIKKDETEHELVKWYIDPYIANHELIYKIISKLVSEIAYCQLSLDDEYIYIHHIYIDGNKVVNDTEIKYESLYPIEIKFIDYLIKQGMKEPKNINIVQNKDKYLISWEY